MIIYFGLLVVIPILFFIYICCLLSGYCSRQEELMRCVNEIEKNNFGYHSKKNDN